MFINLNNSFCIIQLVIVTVSLGVIQATEIGSQCQLQIECRKNSTLNVRLPVKASVGNQGPPGPPGQDFAVGNKRGNQEDLKRSRRQLFHNHFSKPLFDGFNVKSKSDEITITELVVDSSLLIGDDFLLKMSKEYLDHCTLDYTDACKAKEAVDYDQINPYDGLVIDWSGLEGITVKEFWTFFEKTINNSSSIIMHKENSKDFPSPSNSRQISATFEFNPAITNGFSHAPLIHSCLLTISFCIIYFFIFL